MNGPDAVFFLPLAGALLALGCLWGAYRCGRRVRLVDCLPTSKTTGVFIGLVELKGTAEAKAPLRSFLAGCPCVHYSWRVEEHWSRTVRETYRDSQGKTRTRTRRESGWKTVASGGQHIPFYLRDDCGVIRILPRGAKLEPKTVFSETCGRSTPLYYAKGPAFAVRDSDHRRRFTETAIPTGAELYVMGRARERPDIVAAEIAHDPEAPMYLISTRSEEQVSSRLRWSFRGFILLGLILFTGSFLLADVVREIDPAPQLPFYLAMAGAYTAAAGAGWLWMVYNSLIDLRNRVRRGWSLVDVQLKRRHELIPNLVEIIQGFCQHEQTVQAALTELRTQMAATAPGEAGPDPHAVHQLVRGLVERYPEIKAHSLFGKLQKNLVDTEHRIALARGYYNEIATHFRTRLEIIPDRWVGGLAKLEPLPLFVAEDFEREPVQIEATEPIDEEPAGEEVASEMETEPSADGASVRS